MLLIHLTEASVCYFPDLLSVEIYKRSELRHETAELVSSELGVCVLCDRPICHLSGTYPVPTCHRTAHGTAQAS